MIISVQGIILYASFEGIRHRENIGFPNHNFTVDPYFNFTIQPGEERCFEIMINDNVAEDRYENLYYYIGVYNKNMPYQRSSGRIRIEDDEGMLSKNV